MELTLPTGGLKQLHASLVKVFPTEVSAACVVVSPSGVVRYWPSIFSEHEFIDFHLDLKDDSCCSLHAVESSDQVRFKLDSILRLISFHPFCRILVVLLQQKRHLCFG